MATAEFCVDASDCNGDDDTGNNKTTDKEEDIKFMDESHDDDIEEINMDNQRYESLRKGHSTCACEELDNLSNEIVHLSSGDEWPVDRLTSVESGALASLSDAVDINDNDEYLTPVSVAPQYTEIVDRNIVKEISPAGSQIIKERQRVVRMPFLRNFSRACRKLPLRKKRYSTRSEGNNRLGRPPPYQRQASKPMRAVSVACSPQFITLLVLVIVVCVIMAAILIFVYNMYTSRNVPAESEETIMDSIIPHLRCPESKTVMLSQESKRVTLEGAVAEDNLGVRILEYKPIIEDDGAEYLPPFTLMLNKGSVGNTYSVVVTAIDYNDNEATCAYTIAVKEDLCVPWRLPEIEHATREVLETAKGWQVTYHCVNNFTQKGAPLVISYYYPNTDATFTCKTGEDFTPTKPFSCQVVHLAEYHFKTSLNYKFLDKDNTALKNITVGKSQNCFNKFYKNGIIAVQQDVATEVLEPKIKAAASASSDNDLDLSSLELKPIRPGYPQIVDIIETAETDGRVEAIEVVIGYKVGPEDHPFHKNVLNVFVKGILKSYHSTLFMEGMMDFSKIEGNLNAGCPTLRAPPMLSSFEEVLLDFECPEGEKRVTVFDKSAKTDVEACIGCPQGEYYDVVLSSCQTCPRNTYQDEIGSNECKSCPPNTRTSQTGATKQDDCIST